MPASPEPSPWRPPGAEGLVRAGFGVFGCLPADRYDAIVAEPWRCAALRPGARAALVVGNGGSGLWERLQASSEASLERDPVDTYTRRVVEAEAPGLGAGAVALFPFERRGGAWADFVAIAREAGLGAPSRLGMLLHPVYGPWFALRAVILLGEALEAPPRGPAFDPCTGCPAPCTATCPADAPGPGGFDRDACLATRARVPACRLGCDARRACVVGPEHAYPPPALAHHMRHVPVP